MSPQEETLSIPAVASLSCPACGTSNTPDSKFCRHCGQLLRAPEARAKVAVVAGQDGERDEALTSPQEIDARRARQLLDRALHLAERGDLNAAILACRQASTLDANNPAPFAMLGTLLERNGDVRGAVAAYERVLSLSPNSALERESLLRLRARLDRAPSFSFDPDELFGGDDEMLPSLSTAPEDALDEPMSASDAAAVAQTESAAALIAGEGPPPAAPAEDNALAIEARLPPTSASLRASEVIVSEAIVEASPPVDNFGVEEAIPALSAYAPTFAPDPLPASESDPFWQSLAGGTIAAENGAGKPAVSSLAQVLDPQTLAVVSREIPAPTALPSGGFPSIERRQSGRRQVNLPVATDRRTHDRRTPVATAFGFAPLPRASSDAFAPRVAPTGGVRPLDFQFPAAPAPRLPLWALLLRGPSFFGRTLPLIAVGALSLGFLSWARSQAVSREVDHLTTLPTVVVAPVATTPDAIGSPVAATDVAAQTVNNPNPGAPVPVTNASAVPAPAPAPNTPPVPANRPAPRVATAPRPGTAPARPAPAARPRGSAPVFPRVSVAPAPVPAPAAPPPGGGNIILPPPRIDIPQAPAPPIQVGSAFSPGGGPRRNTINITRSEIIRVPPRTGSVARGQERDAATATRTGQTDQAINNLTGAINATGSDAGYLYQQRAMAFMQRGDSAKASDDFQSAINAYQNQIDRGENVAAAQAGLRAAHSGLAVAQASR